MWFRVFSSCLVLDPSLAHRAGKEHWESSEGAGAGTGKPWGHSCPLHTPLCSGDGGTRSSPSSRNLGRILSHRQPWALSPQILSTAGEVGSAPGQGTANSLELCQGGSG